MPNNLFSLFDDRLKSDRDLVAGDPQTLETIAAEQEEQERILKHISRFDVVDPKIDYSDFKNFVFFNSALDYFNITGEKILNEYPFGGTVQDLENFTFALDGYQRYVLSQWPSNSGHLQFDPSVSSSYVSIQDVGSQDQVSRSSFIAPGTGSLTLEFWIKPGVTLTGSNDVMIIAQKISGSDGFTAYLTGSKLGFRMVSGSVTNEIFSPFNSGVKSHFTCVFDRSASPQLVLITGSDTTFPVVVSSGSSQISTPLFLGPTMFSLASGTLTGKKTVAYTGALDQVAVWQTNLSVADLTSSYNTKLYAQKDLIGVWRFSESGSFKDNTLNALVYDASGHGLNGAIKNYFGAVRGSGTVVPFSSPDPLLQYDAPEIQAMIFEQQTSGTLYDRNNDNIITEMLPDKLFELEAEQGTTVLQDFLWILARNFDFMKQRIDQFVKVMRANYGLYDQTPETLLVDIARFFGWDFTGNFLSADAAAYILGKGVLKNTESNKELDLALYQIKNEFLRRVLLNLMYVYKTKGTREGVESLLRTYGINPDIVKLKEYGYKPNVGLNTFRINAEKSVQTIVFGSSSESPTMFISSSAFNSIADSIEVRLRFPTYQTADMTSSLTTGSIWNITSPSSSYSLYYVKNDPVSMTGTFVMTGSEGLVTLTAPVFNAEWYNIVFMRDRTSGSLSLQIRGIDTDTVDEFYYSSVSASVGSASNPRTFYLGAQNGMNAQYWAQEARVWSKVLTKNELDDHALNFQSYGVDDSSGLGTVDLRWKLNGTEVPVPYVSSSITAFKRFLFDYNYIASPDFSWNEEKIRVLDGVEVKPADAYTDNPMVALEFNMIDALNEDISQVLSSMDSFNNSIGLPMNRFRDSYQDLDVIGKSYFSKLQGPLNFRVFADMLEFFDRSFIDMIRKIIPARVVFLGDEFVIESHMLERPKLQWNYRRQPAPFQPEGSITIFSRS